MSEVTTLARPYARAIFGSALEKKKLQEWSFLLEKLSLVASNADIQPVVKNPLIPKKQLADLFIEIAGNSIDEEGKQLVYMLAERKRLNLLPAISKLYEGMLADRDRKIEVKVVSAYPIDSARLQKMALALQNRFQRQVTILCDVDNALLGGAVIYAEGEVIDGSLRNKLKQLSERLST